jgi:outer membrane protein OmpA-like peptidoglycan-associated protein
MASRNLGFGLLALGLVDLVAVNVWGFGPLFATKTGANTSGSTSSNTVATAGPDNTGSASKSKQPAKPEPAKPEPAKPKPAKPEPAKPEPAKPEPAKPEPAKPEPAKPPVKVVKPKPLPSPQTVTFYFRTAKFFIGGNMRRRLNQIVRTFRGHAVDVTVEGHADKRGEAAFNQRLSEQRARRVYRYLRGRLTIKSRVVRGYGQSRPEDPGDTPAALARNRRVVVSVKASNP